MCFYDQVELEHSHGTSQLRVISTVYSRNVVFLGYNYANQLATQTSKMELWKLIIGTDLILVNQDKIPESLILFNKQRNAVRKSLYNTSAMLCTTEMILPQLESQVKRNCIFSLVYFCSFYILHKWSTFRNARECSITTKLTFTAKKILFLKYSPEVVINQFQCELKYVPWMIGKFL